MPPNSLGSQTQGIPKVPLASTGSSLRLLVMCSVRTRRQAKVVLGIFDSPGTGSQMCSNTK